MSNKIIGFENGPLEVNCKGAIFMQEGKKIEVENLSHPCRCGSSKSKPFCDGSHVKVGFSDKKEISDETLQTYEGKNLRINFNRSICAGAGKCVQGLASVFSHDDSDNWIFPDKESNENIINTISTCPSGALSYSIDGKTMLDTRLQAKVSIIKNGPYHVEGIKLEGMPIPTNFSETKYSLCRCGYSKNKPYCDYSHVENNWNEED